MTGEGGEDLVERPLDIAKRFHRRAGAEDVGAADDAGGVLAAFMIALVVVTEFLAAKCGRTAKHAVIFAMAASAVGHKTSK